jgi:hypothetical protein
MNFSKLVLSVFYIDIDEVFDKVFASHPHLLHPNLNKVTLRPWGAKEFAIADKQVGIRFQQW